MSSFNCLCMKRSGFGATDLSDLRLAIKSKTFHSLNYLLYTLLANVFIDFKTQNIIKAYHF